MNIFIFFQPSIYYARRDRAVCSFSIGSKIMTKNAFIFRREDERVRWKRGVDEKDKEKKRGGEGEREIRRNRSGGHVVLSRSTRCPIKPFEPVTPIKSLLNIYPTRVSSSKRNSNGAAFALSPSSPLSLFSSLFRVFAPNKRSRRNKVDAN